MSTQEAIRISARKRGDLTEIRILARHPMETGQRKDDKGRTLPLNHIRTLTVLHNGRPLIDGQLNTAVSKDPLFVFRAREIVPGDKITVRWQDSSGARRQDELTVS